LSDRLKEWRFLAEAWREYLKWDQRGPGKFAEFLAARGWRGHH
jgi:hypothetical protein